MHHTGRSNNPHFQRKLVSQVVTLGVICLILGLLVASLHVLVTIGIVLIVIGLIVNLVPIGGSRRRIY